MIFQVPHARQKPNDTFIPSPATTASPSSNLMISNVSISINDTVQGPPTTEICSETLPELLAPATQEQDTFFLTSTQIGSASTATTNVKESVSENKSDSTKTKKKPTKLVETRRSKREHPPNSPSVASPARKIEKRGSVTDSQSGSSQEGRVTRKTSRAAVAPVSPKLTRNKSKPVPAPAKTKHPVVSIEALPKRVPEPTVMAKTATETNKCKKYLTVNEPEIASKSPQRMSRSLDAPQTPTTPRAPVTRKAVSAKKTTLAPEIVLETPPSGSRARRQGPDTPKTPKVRTSKGSTASPDVIPGSPLGLIGLRSLTKKSLRNRTPAKKIN